MMKPQLNLSAVTVAIAGRTLPPDELAALSDIRLQSRLSLPTLCELTFFKEPGRERLVTSAIAGLSLHVSLSEASEPLFTGEVTAVEYGYESGQGRTLRVRGYDRLHRLRQRQPVRVHVQVDLASLARDLVQDLGLSVQVPGSSVVWPHLIQHGQTDLEFLTQRAESCGCYFTLRGDTLHFLTLEGSSVTEQPLVLGQSLLEARFEVNGDCSCSQVATGGWDPLRVEPHTGRATSPRSGREVAARVPPDWMGGSTERTLVSQAVQDDRQAEALAQAELDVRVAREVTLRGVAEGNPDLAAGSLVRVQGVASELNGRYVLTEVTHRMDSQHRFITEIATAPPVPVSRPRGSLVALGVVTRVNDPENLGRVQVALPAMGHVETDWMGVVLPGAGEHKGLVVLPDVGDHVLVLCPQEDPAQGIVLGGFYGVKGPPDSGVEGSSVKRFNWRTPGGQHVRLDDQRRVVRVENSAGSFVELAPGCVSLHAATDLRIEAPGRAIVIRGKAISFEEA